MKSVHGSKRLEPWALSSEHQFLGGQSGNENDWDGLLELKPVHPRNTRVLLVDDDPDQLLALSFVLSKNGYRVTIADSVREAISLLQRNTFHVLVSDLRMPEMDGFEFLKAVRALEGPQSYREMPIIMLTGANGDIELAALEQGADMFCEKFRAPLLLPKQVQFLLE
jgi:CheY-like chemotaxis protein